MCFSPEASFIAAGVLAPVGVATLRSVRRREDLVFAAVPLLFAAHQAVEGVVWLGLEGHLTDRLLEAAIGTYLLFAQVVLPVLVPIGVLLFERDPGRRRRLIPFVLLGSVVSARLLWVITTHPVGAQALDHSIVYDTDAHFGYVVAAGYVVATCGPALLSSNALLSMFGVANLVGVGIASVIRYSAVTSVWCFYAALVSLFIALVVRRSASQTASPSIPAPTQLASGSRASSTGTPAM